MGGFGISAVDDFLLIKDICLIKQFCTEVTVRFDDQAVADHFDQQVDAGLLPERFARIWVHTHPGKSPHPSHTDEQTFQRCFGGSEWAVMFIVARGGQTYARLRLSAGPGGELVLPVEVDFRQPFPESTSTAWQREYEQSVVREQPLAWLPLREWMQSGEPARRHDEPLDPDNGFDPFSDDQAFYTYLESIDDNHRHPF